MRRIIGSGAAALLIALVAPGCSPSQGTAVQEKPAGTAIVDQKPVTVTVGINTGGYLNEEEFKRYITDPVHKKYPWITIERVLYDKGRSTRELVAIGETPDITITNNINGMQGLVDLKIFAPMDDLIKKHNIDLNRIEPEALEAIKSAMQTTDLVALPYTRHFAALYYNKDIFDKFGVPYPKDGMTWDDVYELARKVTRNEDNVQYRGLEPNYIERPASQLSLPYVDPKTNKSLLNTEPWKRVLSFMEKVHRIPGNSQIIYGGDANNLFAKNKTLAMLASNNIIFDGNLYKTPDLNWDMVSYPTWPEAPGLSLRIDEHVLAITSTSKNRDAAMLAINAVLSDEVQMDMSRQGRFSILKDAKIKASYGADMPFMNGKNIGAVSKTTPAKSFVTSKYDNIAATAMNNALKDIINNGKDVNTALRTADETVNQQIKTAEAGQ
ncbi:ABC transporter substrate-binding protein [Paenibacillus allorhizosphaerae]|uniref:Extracellular solute-binding protein n=1 Tax=Paenibacillus allorhizosphaerae TaxID=2849866 RepID=A0ABN7THB8_9BACL|nr:extracellular solute-binding protein [Paenibacillus allorhizosphaerae]CAG7625070.1 hypothetical protein PAECIP111802_01128 [Paenibacillus allorhizosphaerae]